jgi:hypothetical protein
MLDQLMRDRRPEGWQQWAEVVWREKRNPKFIGDMPHTWVGSDFIRSALDLFAYREPCTLPRTAGGVGRTYTPMPCVLNIGKAIPGKWLMNGDSVVVRGLRTGGVTVGYTMKMVGRTVVINFDATPRQSDMVVFPPIGLAIATADVDGKRQPAGLAQPVLVPGTTRRVVFTLE